MIGFRLTSTSAIKQVDAWRKIDHPNVVSVQDVFTTQDFQGDSSLIFVYDYFPLSKTLVEEHSPTPNRYGRTVTTMVPDTILWSYIVQLSSAMSRIHAAGLAVRCMDPSKIILTDKNRVRLAACSIFDVVKFGEQRSLKDLQQDDLRNLGMLILGLGVNNLSPSIVVKNAIE